MDINKRIINTEYLLSASPDDRIRAAEIEIENILKYHGCKLGISLIKLDGKNIHQEIIVLDRRD